jgi:nucleotide-binding universal stress UspA family protein
MNTVLVPLDGSTLAAQILPYAEYLARSLDARVHLMQVVSDVSQFEMQHQPAALHYAGMPYEVHSVEENDDAYAEAHRQIMPYLEEQAATMQALGLAVTCNLYFGNPAARIVEVARTRDATVIAMATHGYTGLKRWTLGSVTDKVIHATHTPVFVVRSQDEAAPLPTPRLRRILVPLDGSALARQALPCAMRLAQATDGQIVLLRVVSDIHPMNQSVLHPGYPPRLYADILSHHHDEALDSLHREARELAAQGLATETEAVVGYPPEAIVEAADTQDCDLIVMATHGYTGVQRWVLGSTADKVLHATTCPLVLIHATHHS